MTFIGGNICVKAANSCFQSAFSCLYVARILLPPATPGPISGPVNVCGPTTVTYSVPLVPNATSYTWVVNGVGLSILSGQGTNSINVSVAGAFQQGTVSVYASNGDGNSGTTIMSIYGILASQPNLALFPTVGVCGGGTYSFCISPYVGATALTWTAPSGAIISDGVHSGNPLVTTSLCVTITFPVGFVSGNISIYGSTYCSVGPARIVGVRSTPGQPISITGPNTGVCGQNGVVYSISPVSGATSYTWTVPPGVVKTFDNNGTSITVNFTSSFTTSGNICVTPNNACGAGIQRCQNVTSRPAIPGAIVGPTSVCKSQFGVGYSVPAVLGATSYTWSVTGSILIGITTSLNTATLDFRHVNCSSIVLSVYAKNACGFAAAASSITIAIDTLCRSMSSDTLITSTDLNAYPNPTSGKLNVKFNAASDSYYKLKVVDMIGREILNIDTKAQEGENIQELDLTHVSKGIYLLSIEGEGIGKETLRVIVQ